MVSLREFEDSDAAVLRDGQCPSADMDEVIGLIGSWKEKTYNGRYFEMLAVTQDGRAVGSVSLLERSPGIVSAGIEIFPDERRKGYAAEAMRLILARAAEKGYKGVQDQVAQDNLASRTLHEKVGFETDGYVYTNSRGHDVLIYTYFL